MLEERQAFLSLCDPAHIHDDETHLTYRRPNVDVILLHTGVTTMNSYKLLPYLEDETVSHVIQVGTCAGLQQQNIGEVIHFTRFRHRDIDTTFFPSSFSPSLFEGEDESGALLVTGNQFLSTQEDAKRIQQTFHAQGYDMEAFGFFVMCQQFNVPFTSVRAVSDNGEHHAYDQFEKNLPFAAKCAAEAVFKTRL